MNNFINNLLQGTFESWVLFTIAIITIIYFTHKGVKIFGKLRLKNIKTPFFDAEFKVGEYQDIPHKKCLYSKDIFASLNKQNKNLRIICEIKRQIYRDLMNIAEDIVDVIIDQMRSVFLKLLKDKKGVNQGLINDPSYVIYNYTLVMGKKSVMKEILRAIEENSFLEKEQKREWERYKETKAQNLISIVKNSLNNFYIFDGKPSVEDIYKEKEKEFLTIGKQYYLNKHIDQMFNSMIDCLREHNVKISKLEDENTKIIIALLGE